MPAGMEASLTSRHNPVARQLITGIAAGSFHDPTDQSEGNVIENAQNGGPVGRSTPEYIQLQIALKRYT